VVVDVPVARYFPQNLSVVVPDSDPSSDAWGITMKSL